MQGHSFCGRVLLHAQLQLGRLDLAKDLRNAQRLAAVARDDEARELRSAAAVAPFQDKRSISIMGDGGFWHNGLTTGVIGTMLNEGDSVLVIMQNGFTSATGQQFIPSSEKGRGGRKPGMSIENTLQSLGVPWLRKVRTYSVSEMVDTLREALTTPEKGLKVIIADGECQLARQRRLRGEHAE